MESVRNFSIGVRVKGTKTVPIFKTKDIRNTYLHSYVAISNLLIVLIILSLQNSKAITIADERDISCWKILTGISVEFPH